jgi:AraC-like DNA-binding protein
MSASFADLRNPRRGETVAEIAYRWGFGGHAQFSRHFKSHFGKTPREIRLSSPQSAER